MSKFKLVEVSRPGLSRAMLWHPGLLLIAPMLLFVLATGVAFADSGGGNADEAIEAYVDAHTSDGGALAEADLSSATFAASASVAPNGTIRLVLTVPNAGMQDTPAQAMITLPDGLRYVSHACDALVTDACAVEGQTVRWEGVAVAGRDARLSVQVRAGAMLRNGTELAAAASVLSSVDAETRDLTVTVDSLALSNVQILQMVTYGLQPQPPQPVVSVTKPDGKNSWTVSWTAAPGATGYELQQANTPDFNAAYTYRYVDETSHYVEVAPTPNHIYYYRVRSKIGQVVGPWSNVAHVVSGYYDEFSDPSTGWSLVRSTYKEEVRSYYDIRPDRHWYVIQSEDRWDWGIASPGVPAPEPPYYIEYMAKMLHVANLQSHGAVFGGDWPSVAGCPADPDSFDGFYKHQDCFNHFYDTNTIFFGGLKLLFERIDYLQWCVPCAGSPLKRIGDANSDQVKTLVMVHPTDWNRYRIEVREDSIKFYAAEPGQPPKLEKTYYDTRWVNEPYFGLMVTTDEYSNSWWAIEYYKVMPLDE